jgi:hypothetical protein
MRDDSTLGPEARLFADTWGPRARGIMRVLSILAVALLVTWLLGRTSLRLFLFVAIVRLLIPAAYGYAAGKKIGADRRAQS